MLSHDTIKEGGMLCLRNESDVVHGVDFNPETKLKSLVKMLVETTTRVSLVTY